MLVKKIKNSPDCVCIEELDDTVDEHLFRPCHWVVNCRVAQRCLHIYNTSMYYIMCVQLILLLVCALRAIANQPSNSFIISRV